MRPEAGVYLWDAAAAARLVQEFTHGKTEIEFNTDPLLRSGVERQLEILGESLNRLRKHDVDTSARVPDLDRIVGMRNIIAHEYGEVDYEIVWRAAKTSVPSLIPILDDLIDEARGLAGF